MDINLVIPIAGEARRFQEAGYTLPKPMISCGGSTILETSLGCFDFKNTRCIFIAQQKHNDLFNIGEFIRKVTKNLDINNYEIIYIDGETEGAICTCLKASKLINNDKPLYIYTPDVEIDLPYKMDLSGYGDALRSNEVMGEVLTFKSNSPDHSYARCEYYRDRKVVEVAEKKVISNDALVGLYGFISGKVFVKYANKLVRDQKNKVKGEFYIAPVYNYLVNKKGGVYRDGTPKVHVLGTPEDLEFYTKYVSYDKTFCPIVVCSDHSGLRQKDYFTRVLEDEAVFHDVGCFGDKPCDHYDYLSVAIKEIKDGYSAFGIAFCRTGQAFNIAANKVEGIRSALIYSVESAQYAIKHNAVNFFCIPESVQFTAEDVQKIFKYIKEESFDGGRHAVRIQKTMKGMFRE